MKVRNTEPNIFKAFWNVLTNPVDFDKKIIDNNQNYNSFNKESLSFINKLSLTPKGQITLSKI